MPRKRQQQQLLDELKIAEEKIVDNQARINELTCRITELERDLGNRNWTIERKFFSRLKNNTKKKKLNLILLINRFES